MKQSYGTELKGVKNQDNAAVVGGDKLEIQDYLENQEKMVRTIF